jgi:hypothetical protein
VSVEKVRSGHQVSDSGVSVRLVGVVVEDARQGRNRGILELEVQGKLLSKATETAWKVVVRVERGYLD